ncbi:MAG: nuclear transport factor 2 family protein [Pseudomonadota bacterium]
MQVRAWVVNAVLLSTLAALAACDNRSKALDAEVTALRSELAQVKRQAQHAEDYIAISNLQRAYGYYMDKALWEQATDLFARDATLEISGRGVFKGRDRVRHYLHMLPVLSEGSVFLHLQLQPVITIAADGQTAQGRWRALFQIGEVGKRSDMGEGIYENVYVREDGVWKFSKLHFFANYLVDTQDGWRKPGQPLPGPFKNLPPDEPTTVPYTTYPGVFIPPFHYPNPVTGRPSQ